MVVIVINIRANRLCVMVLCLTPNSKSQSAIVAPNMPINAYAGNSLSSGNVAAIPTAIWVFLVIRSPPKLYPRWVCFWILFKHLFLSKTIYKKAPSLLDTLMAFKVLILLAL